MGPKEVRGDINYAWPSAEIAVRGPDGAIEVLEDKYIRSIENEEERDKYKKKKLTFLSAFLIILYFHPGHRNLYLKSILQLLQFLILKLLPQLLRLY